ncbi:MAG: hypothetical protein HYV39_01900 [Candidatus Levybacteria bacterium]|nr:hypothetical protein [Candidatus Levybacteria bacterium]
MDPNQNQMQNQPIQEAPPVPTEAGIGNNKKLLFSLVVAIVLGLGVVIFFLMKQETPASPQIITPPPSQPTQPPATPTQTPEEELDQITIENPDEDIKDINTDLQEL